jgi:3-hydroxyacyl-CoA dehydrogenase
MKASVTFSREGRIGLVLIDNPPVNAISPAVTEGLVQALARFEASPELQALVLCCAGRTWVAGGDIAAFESPTFTAAPLNHFLSRLEAQSRPVVAALHGTALGGGLELALACHHRVARPETRFGMPEVKIGLLPGSLGTQRLPRLVGAELALDLISSGRMLAAAAAQRAGLIDVVAEGEPREIGLAAAQRLLEIGAAPHRTSALSAAPASETVLQQAEAAAAKKPGWPQLAAIVRCIRAAQTLSFAEGEAVEKAAFADLVPSASSKALRHLFFAEREAARIPEAPRGTALRPIRRVGIVGAGTMGGGIAMNFANVGIPTLVVEVSDEALQRGLDLVRKNYEASAAKGRLTLEQVEQRMALLQGALDHSALTDCDLLIEAVFEDLVLKQEVCARLGAVAKPGAIIATNTSTLDVDVLAQATGRPADVVGMHFFSPANVMRLLEVVRGEKTAPDVLATVMKLAGAIGKVPVISGVCYGFIGNRMAESTCARPSSCSWKGPSRRRWMRQSKRWAWRWAPAACWTWPVSTWARKLSSSTARQGGCRPTPATARWCASSSHWAASARRQVPATTATKAARRRPTLNSPPSRRPWPTSRASSAAATSAPRKSSNGCSTP